MRINSINPYLVNMLLPENNNNLFRNKKFNNVNNIMANTFNLINKLQSMAMAIKTGVAVEQDSGLDHSKYITPNNPVVRSLAREITNYSDSGAEKMYKIEQWVQRNIEYKTDIENYGALERWAYPIETLSRKSGDCEDQAFLVHALGLASGVDPNRLRTYGGLVFDPNSTAPGGHGWTVYRREGDSKWVTLDSTYYRISDPIVERKPISEDLRYIDDFWYIQAGQTIATPYANKVRYAKGHLLDVLT